MQRALFERMTDRAAWLTLSAVLFLTAAWPLALVDLPPLQDLPNHLATARILGDLGAFPEYAFNGFFKTNTALFLWLRFVGAAIGARAAAKLFVALVLAANALVLPRLVLELVGRRAMLVSTVCAWPLVHHWFVTMGMLDYALGVAIALELVVLFARQGRAPRASRALLIAALGAALWLTHAMALLVVLMLALLRWIEVEPPAKRNVARLVLAPLAPTMPLVLWSIAEQLRSAVGGPGGHAIVQSWVWVAPWELLYNAWAESLWGFTNRELPQTMMVAIVLATWLYRGRAREVPVLSRRAVLAFAALFFFSPYHAANWFHVGSRFLPFLWVAALVRVPERVPRALAGALGAAWLTYSAAMGADYLAGDRAWRTFTRGEGAVSEGASLLPLMFAHKEGSVNTANMLHAWGLYVADRGAHVPLVFAHSRSFPITLRAAPPPALDQRYLENFASTMQTQAHFCTTLERVAIAPADCAPLYDAAWRDFWSIAEPRFDHVLFYAASEDAIAHVPTSYARAFASERVVVFARQSSSAAASSMSKPSE